MRGMDRFSSATDFMQGLRSLTNVRVGHQRENHHSFTRSYESNKREYEVSSFFSVGGIEIVKSTGNHVLGSVWPFVELEVMDFVGGACLAETRSQWDTGPGALELKMEHETMNTRAHLGPRRICGRRTRWRCYTRDRPDIWWAI